MRLAALFGAHVKSHQFCPALAHGIDLSVLASSQIMYTCFGLLLTLLTPNQLMAQLLAAAFNQLWSYFK